MEKPTKPLTLWFLQASRCIRTAWQLEAQGLPYEVRFSDRDANQKAPADFKAACGNPLGKFPTLQDGDLTVVESGAIAEYLCDAYDPHGRLLPREPAARAPVLGWLHAAEATFMVHALALMYMRWGMPADVKKERPDVQEALENFLSTNIKNDLKWLETTLVESKSGWVAGGDLSIADIALHFSVDIVFKRQIGVKSDADYPKIKDWLARCEATDSFRRAVEKTGHTMTPQAH